MYVNQLPLFSNPRCSVSLKEYSDQPTDRRHKTLILTLRVTLRRPSTPSSAAEVRHYTRNFSEPLPVFTHPRHVWAARKKVGRMLDALWVPRRIPRNLCDKIIAGVRRVASDFEDPPPVLRAEANVDAFVLRLPPAAESEWEEEEDGGAPTYLDGADSRDFERYKDEDDPDDRFLYNDDYDLSDYDDDEDYAGWPDGGEERVVCRSLLDDELEPGDEYFPRSASGRNQMVVVSLHVTFRLPPPLFAGDEQMIGRNFCETLEVLADERQEATALHRISLMLRRVRVPQRFVAENAERVLREVRSAAQRRWCDFDVMWMVLTLEVFTLDPPGLSTTFPLLPGTLNYFRPNSGVYMATYRRRNRLPPPPAIDDVGLDDGTHPRFVPACREAIESLEKMIISEGDDMSMDCTVCLEDIPVGSEVTRLPCCHYFHEVCIVKWLETSKYCPVCRFELP